MSMLESTATPVKTWEQLPLIMDTRDVARTLYGDDPNLSERHRCNMVYRLVGEGLLMPIPGFKRPLKFYKEAVRAFLEQTVKKF